jgi:hypothetical protein
MVKVALWNIQCDDLLVLLLLVVSSFILGLENIASFFSKGLIKRRLFILHLLISSITWIARADLILTVRVNFIFLFLKLFFRIGSLLLLGLFLEPAKPSLLLLFLFDYIKVILIQLASRLVHAVFSKFLPMFLAFFGLFLVPALRVVRRWCSIWVLFGHFIVISNEVAHFILIGAIAIV